jgi:hypothetical protein
MIKLQKTSLISTKGRISMYRRHSECQTGRIKKETPPYIL